MKRCLFFFFFSFLLLAIAFADDTAEAEAVNVHELSLSPVYVSLGSVCEVSHVLRLCDLRKAAFPFDWITTLDSEKFLKILEDDFQYFLDKKYLYGIENDPGPLLNTYYHLEFLHDGDFRTRTYAANMQKFQDKYQRRIERFRMLSEYPGTVIFIRTAYAHSVTDPHRIYRCADNIEIDDDYAWRLYNVLQNKFPGTDFILIIINNDKQKEESLFEEKRLAPNLIKLRTSLADPKLKKEMFTHYFESLSSG